MLNNNIVIIPYLRLKVKYSKTSLLKSFEIKG